VTRAEVGGAGVEGREVCPAGVIIWVVLRIGRGVIVREEERGTGRVTTDEGGVVMGCLLMVLVVRVMWLEDAVIFLRDVEILKRGSMIDIGVGRRVVRLRRCERRQGRARITIPTAAPLTGGTAWQRVE
jgi:hypothetical protein